MKSLFSDNRLASILHLFHNTQTMSVGTMASKLQVSDRTIRNDIKQLNQMLSGCATIEGTQGRYSLRVYDPEKYQEFLIEISEADDFLNSPRNRIDYIFGKLLRADMPILTDDLAYEMSIGRTTIMGDLKKLRSDLEEYQLTVQGKTNQGLTLYGNETDIRRYVLDNCFDAIYDSFPMDEEIDGIIDRFFEAKHFEQTSRKNFRRYVILMLDRFLTGHYIGQLSQKAYNLTSRNEYAAVNHLVDEIGASLGIDFPPEEKLFVFLPISGMRTPADSEGLRSIELDESIRPLLPKIIEQIQNETNLNIDLGDFTDEFLYHLMFMINRMRFGIKLPNPMAEDMIEKYPLAFQVAGIASDVVSREYGLKVTRDEQAYLATYFGVFLTESKLRLERQFRIAAVYSTGRVTGRLMEMQLRRVINHSAVLTMLSLEEATTDRLDKNDLVLTTVELTAPCHKPVISINEVFNEQELRRKIDKARYQVDSPNLDSNWFIMAGLIDEERFFVLDCEQDYQTALKQMILTLTEAGDVDDGFLDRLEERERQGTMVFGNAIALPHGVQYATEGLVLAVGVFGTPIEYLGNEISIIFLLGLPEQEKEDDNLLIRIYDEIITISHDEELRNKLASSKSYLELRHGLYRQAD